MRQDTAQAPMGGASSGAVGGWSGPRLGAWSARRSVARVRARRLVGEPVPVRLHAVQPVRVGAGRRLLRVIAAALQRPEPSDLFAARPAHSGSR